MTNNSLTQRQPQAPAEVFNAPEQVPQANIGAVGFLAVEKEAKQMEIAMVTAKRFPRDITSVESKIAYNCSRERLAAAAEYSFPRGRETVSGPSVRLLEVVAQCYGNVEFGVSEIQRYDGYSECEAFAWDFENNIRMARKFTVPHFRDTKQGKIRITEDRDIREIVFNFGSRNMRACLERVIPRDLVEFALDECRKTLNAGGKGLADRIQKCKEAFKEFAIDAILLERIIGEKCANWNNGHLRMAIQYYNALKDGETTKQALTEGIVRTIGKAQIDELTALVGTNQARIDALKALGYDMGEIKNIPAVDYDQIKTKIQNTNGDVQQGKPTQDGKVDGSEKVGENGNPSDGFNPDAFFANSDSSEIQQ